MSRVFYIALLVPLLNSDLFAERMELTFNEALSLAIRNNPQILSLREQIKIYEMKEKEAFSGFLPQLNLSALYKRTTANSPAQVGLKLPSSLSSVAGSITGKRESMNSYNNYSIGLSLNQLIWDFGRTSGMYDSARFNMESAKKDLLSAMDNLVVSMYQSVLNYNLTKELYEASLIYERQMESHLMMARAQVESGIRTNVDLLRAESDLYSARLNTLKVKNSLALINLNLKNLMGIPEEVDLDIRPPDKNDALKIPEGGYFDYIQKRPEYISYRKKIDSLKALLKSSQSGYFPYLYLTGALTYSGYSEENMVYNWNVGATLNWNLFSGLYTLSNEREIRAQIRMYEALLDQMVKNLYLEIENAKLAYEEARERLHLTDSMLKTAEESLRLIEARYKSGLGTFIEVSDAQSVYINAKNSYIQAEYDLLLSSIRLKRALGLITYEERGE